ncbi:IS256 family transposase [Actinomarinicola tropica]|uniref:Mutator family transposase n=1 Tax=Actinomarinicola tropica TaxID=2789776 RepID=A0A5Q2RJI1_9ACTN|nr:IS256 family transposase [Actinomarinicola tropica]
MPEPVDVVGDARRAFAEQLVEEAKAKGQQLVGPDGVLAEITKLVLETGVEVELSEHLGYDKHDPAGRNGGNSRNGTRSKTVITDIGPVTIDVPRDRDGTFEPATVRKRQRRLEGVDAMVLSLWAKGLTTGEISAHLAEVYGTQVSKTISKITDAVIEEMSDWLLRPLEAVYPVIFIDAIHVKVRDGQVANRAFDVAIGVTVDGKRDILGIRPSNGAEGAKFWLGVLTEIKNRGVGDVCIVVCDGLKGLPDAITTTWPRAVVQTCVLHLLRNTFRLTSRADWDRLAKDLRPIYTAVNEDEARGRLEECCDKWGKYPAIRTMWESAWPEFVPFLDYETEIRRVIYSTNAIESLHARMRRATRARGHFPNEQAAMKCLYLVVRSLDPTGKGAHRWMNRWKPALNAFAITFEGRLFPTDQ